MACLDEEPAALAVTQVMCSITAKRDWQGKVRTSSIVAKWREEAALQGAPLSAFDAAVRELRGANATYMELAGIAYRDGLLPQALRAQLTDCLDRLFERSTDFQPDTGNTVVNLIHPSLFPYVSGESFCTITRPHEKAPAESKSAGALSTRANEVRRSHRFAHCVVGVEESSKYQWLPAEFHVDANGTATVVSYINNAPFDKALHDTLGATFSHILPLFEQVVTPPGMRHLVRLRDRQLQVIVKAATYVLKPGQSYEGSWHVEGMQHERIVAAGIVYSESSACLRGEGLAFRRLRNRNVVGHKIPVEVFGHQEYRERPKYVVVEDGPYASTNGSSVRIPATKVVVLEESMGSSLGVKINRDAGDALLVTLIKDVGKVATWNAAHPAEAVCVGDRIVQVNQVSGNAEALFRECAKGGRLELVVQCAADSSSDESEEDNVKVPTGFLKPKYTFSGSDVHAKTLWEVGYKTESLPNHVELGQVSTPAGRCLAFKNSLQHRVEMLWNSSDSETALRKVLVFWLVDPDRPIISSADVPPQQWERLMPLIAHSLYRQWRPRGRNLQLRTSCVKLILEFARWGLTLEEALAHRLQLMEHRKFSEVVNGQFTARIVREYSFCEH